MGARTALKWLIGLACVAAIPSMAHEPSGNPEEWRYAATPFFGWRSGGDFDFESADQDADVRPHISGALALEMNIDGTSAYQLFYSSQETTLETEEPLGGERMEVRYLHFGGTLVTVEDTWVKPYISGGIGLTQLDLDVAGAAGDTRFSLSIAGGLRFPVTRSIDVRVEARGYLTFLASDSEVFCGSNQAGGTCLMHSTGTVFQQIDLLAGFMYRF